MLRLLPIAGPVAGPTLTIPRFLPYNPVGGGMPVSSRWPVDIGGYAGAVTVCAGRQRQYSLQLLIATVLAPSGGTAVVLLIVSVILAPLPVNDSALLFVKTFHHAEVG